MRPLLVFVSLLFCLSASAQPLRFSALTTNRTMVTFTNGEVAVWNDIAKAWSNGVATGQSATQVSNIVNAIITNVATTVILTATNFEESYTFHLDWKNGNDATAKPNDPRFPWKTPTNVVAAMRTYINNGTNYLKLVGRPGVYTNAHFTSASGGVSHAGPIWFSPTNVIWELEGVEFFNPVTNECNTILITNANNFIIHGLTLRSTRQSGTTNDRSGVLHGAIQIAGTARRLKFDRMTFTNYTRHCVTPAFGFVSESTVYEDCQFWRYGATNTADFGGIDGQAIPLLANTLVRGCHFYDGTRGLESEGFVNGNQTSFGAIVQNCTFNRISEASILIIPDFNPLQYYSILIQGNFFNGTGMDFPYAIISRGGLRQRILDNYITDYYTGIMLEADATINYLLQVKGNTIVLTDRPLLCLDNQNEGEAITKADITDNIIHTGTEFGMYLNINNSVVENNTIDSVSEKGIWLAGNTTVNDPCQNNIIRNNQIWDTDGTGLFIESTVLNTRVENNIISGSSIADFNKNGATNVSEMWHSITGLGLGTNAPAATLQVHGTFKYPLGAVDGYKMLSTNGGVGFWAPDSGGSGTPGGTNTQVQFNDSGVFNGATNVFFDKANRRLGVGKQVPLSTLHVDGAVRMTNLSFHGFGGGALVYHAFDSALQTNSAFTIANGPPASMQIWDGTGGILYVNGVQSPVGATSLGLLGGTSSYQWLLDSDSRFKPGVSNVQEIGEPAYLVSNIWSGRITLSSNGVGYALFANSEGVELAAGTLIVNSNITARGSLISEGVPPFLQLRSTNDVGSIAWTLPAGDWQPTNVFILQGSNWVAGQTWIVASVSGNEVTMTNGTVSSSSGSSTNFDNITVTNMARFLGPMVNTRVLAPYVGTNVVINANLGTSFYTILTNTLTGLTITNGTDGQKIEWLAIQDATGSRDVSLVNQTLGSASTNFWNGGVEITIPTPPVMGIWTNAHKATRFKAEFVSGIAGVQNSTNRWDLIGFLRGY